MERGLNSWIDFTVIGIYFLFVIGVGVMSMCRKNRESVQGYFLAGRSMHWIPIGASLFASNIGSEHFVGLAGSGAASGIAVVSFEWGAVILLVLLGWIFLPIYLTAQVYTIPEYLGRRFGGYRMRLYQSSVALFLYVLSKVSVDVYAGGVFIQQATGWNLYLSMIPLLLVTALYTIAGGLAAVVFTDALQTVVMLIGAVILAVMCYIKVGGLGALYSKYMHAVPTITTTTPLLDHHNTTYIFPITIANITTSSYSYNYSDYISGYVSNHSASSQCGLPRHDAFHIFRDPVHSDLPWPGVMIRATLASLWNWCADQVIVQRALAARSMAHAQAACLMAGFLKFTPLFLIIIPGMISRVLYPDLVACNDPDTCEEVCNNPSGCSNIAYPLLILRMAPKGMRGLLMAVMVAALMSSLTSIFNSAGTIFTMDVWRKIRPRASEKQLLVVGRLFVVVLLVVSMAWIPLIGGSQEGQLFMYIQAVTGYIAPPICSVFLLAIFVPRVNERGAFWGVLAGQATGVTRLILDFVYPAPACGHPDTRPLLVSKIHFTYFSGIVLGVTAIVALLVSLTQPAQDPQEIEGLTWWSLCRQRRRQTSRKTRDAKTDTGSTEEGIELTVTESERHGSKRMVETDDTAAKSPKFDSVVPPPWCHVLNCGAVVLLALLAFLFGFFA